MSGLRDRDSAAGAGRPAPLISVVTVCFDAADSLERTIRSLLSQTYLRFEYIVVDGGSTDGTLGILGRYRDRISTLVSEPDCGIYHAMNKGVLLARGEWIYFLNADDSFHDDGVLALFAELEKRCPEAEVIYGDALLSYPDGSSRLSRYPGLITWEHLATRSLCHQAMFTRRSAFERVGLYDPSYRLAGDYAWLLKSIWRHDLNYRYLPFTVCRFSMAGEHLLTQNASLLQQERERAAREEVAGRFDFIGSYQRKRITLGALLGGDPDLPCHCQRETFRLVGHLFRYGLHRMLRRLGLGRSRAASPGPSGRPER